ncbi:HlyD family efflux transporter periplasmic adaptor subunit [Undibacterium sp. CY7W]|uniref:HlyD family efflux transporter periplasmic adaptor subunit n=1 Tax=Undibacterium rugosum TaxID=2762291 RepID=A0A923I389_9BURK|nr:HlyD family efflux transporter periplasmic adaptor subunit [Undibacterium rugosum]MBC3936302.1 HlyD family efflux transporter periplasmic adaptor subunit [Undibacterium rugosum]
MKLPHSLCSVTLAALLSPALAAAPESKLPTLSQRKVYITGEVVAADSQLIFVPPSNSSPVALRKFVGEGKFVHKGDVVLSIEAQNSGTLEQLQTTLEQTRAKLDAEVAKLEVAALEADKALANMQAAHDKAEVDAALPKTQISALDFDKNQTEKEKAIRDLEVRQLAAKTTQAAVLRMKQDGELDIRKQHIKLEFTKQEIARSSVIATQDGFVTHSFNTWPQERIDEGSSVHPGTLAGTIVGNGKIGVKGWVLEADRLHIRENMAVSLQFDALPGQQANSVIKTISQAPELKADWGNGRYFRVDIPIPEQFRQSAAPGMSVLIQPAEQKTANNNKVIAPAKLTLEGEVQSRVNLPVAPPAIPYIWQYTIAQLAPEGSLLKAGDLITQFQAAEVMSQLARHKSTRNEKQRALEKLRLDQAEAERSATLAVDEARANADKAARKATMPKELIRRVDYDKLVIEKALSLRLLEIEKQLNETRKRARLAEKKALEFELMQSQNKINLLEQGQARMTVKAEQPGILIYKTNFNDEKFSSGSKIWMGQSLANLSDPKQLFVNAQVAEAQAAYLRTGLGAKVSVPGGNQMLNARITQLGKVFHSKSATQPGIVRDIELEFEQNSQTSLKPGSAVQVQIQLQPASASVAAASAKGGL